ncbi:hypothetical protein CEXT_63171, partial [Caerostris extrusa]
EFNTDSPSICRNPCSPISTSCTTKTVNPYLSEDSQPFVNLLTPEGSVHSSYPSAPQLFLSHHPLFIDQPVVFHLAVQESSPQDQILIPVSGPSPLIPIAGDIYRPDVFLPY